MTAQEWLEIYDKEKPYGCSAEIAASIIRDQQDELPEISMPLRPEVLFFAERMECKLRLNDHKQHWRDFNIEYLMRRLKEEVAELEDTIASGGTRHQQADEAADVANFAMMIADSLTQPCERTKREGK